MLERAPRPGKRTPPFVTKHKQLPKSDGTATKTGTIVKEVQAPKKVGERKGEGLLKPKISSRLPYKKPNMSKENPDKLNGTPSVKKTGLKRYTALEDNLASVKQGSRQNQPIMRR